MFMSEIEDQKSRFVEEKHIDCSPILVGGNVYNKQEIEQYLANPTLNANAYYEPTNNTGYASIDRPHLKFYKKNALDAVLPKMKMYDYLYLKNQNNLNNYALNYYGRKITYASMFDNIEKVAKSFIRMGIKENDYVVIAMPNIPESVYILFALNRIGAVAVELDPRTTKNDVCQTLEESQARCYITIEDCSIFIDEILTENMHLKQQIKKVLLISPTQSLPMGINILSDFNDFLSRKKGSKPKIPANNKFINWKTFLKCGESCSDIIDSKYHEDTVVEIIYSSGTTATPKPIQYTNETFTSMTRQLELGENCYAIGDKNLDIIPMFLGFGSNSALFVILCFGLENILIPVPVIDGLPELIKKYHPNHILGAPIHMKVLLKYLRENPSDLEDLSFLKSIVSGSAHLESTIQYGLDSELEKRGCKTKVGPGYGQNEGGPGLSFSSDSFLQLKKPGCSGYPMIFTTISIFDADTDEELPYGQNIEGEIRYKTPCSMKGYAFHREEDTKKFYKKGRDGAIWCCSGDLGMIDADGGIYITGRKMRQIRRGGFKFSPTEIEDFIMQKVPEIESCALVAKPDNVQENMPVLFYSVKAEHKKDSALIRSRIIKLCSTLKDYKIPEIYIQKDELPITPNLKVDFKALEKETLQEDDKMVTL